jgi:C1A family cysteine protease
MKNKIIVLFVCLLLISVVFPNVSSEYKEDLNIKKKISIRSNLDSNNGFYIDFEIDKEEDIISPKPLIINDLPDYFSWNDFEGQDWTTPAKDQGNCGSCWLCAALGALECIIKIREGCSELSLDLSEQYVLSCMPLAGTCWGGWAYKGYKYIMKNNSYGNYCNGIIPEFCFPYMAIDSRGCNSNDCDHDPVECEEKCLSWQDFLIPISDYGYWRPNGSQEDKNAIKSQILESGPVVAVMMATYYPHGENNLEEWGWQHSNPNDYFSYPGPIDGSNHQVVIIGWKDDPDIQNGGYWICKNSFSEEWGYNGFFNIEYGSLNIDNKYIDWVDYDPDSYSNWLPITNANGMYYATTGEEIVFDASKSIDHEGEIISYYWDFGDGYDSIDCISPHTYNGAGIYPILLRIVDNEGNIAEDNTWAFIDNTNTAPNSPILKGATEIKNGTSYEYTFHANDPDGDEVYYYLNWGDTYWVGWWEGWIGPYESGERVTLENTWDEKGNYTLRVRAKDKYGAKSDWTVLKIKTAKSKHFSPYPTFRNHLELPQQLLPFIKLLIQFLGK